MALTTRLDLEYEYDHGRPGERYAGRPFAFRARLNCRSQRPVRSPLFLSFRDRRLIARCKAELPTIRRPRIRFEPLTGSTSRLPTESTRC